MDYKRHIADPASNESYTVAHWGYVVRTLPCTNDAGSCEYLDAVYWMHDVSMLYTFILWAVIGGVLVTIVALRLLKPRAGKSKSVKGLEDQVALGGDGVFYRSWRGIQSSMRRWLLPESFVGVFGHVTRLQVLVLAILLGYLLIFSLVGIVYKTWITPVKSNPKLHNTRVGMGGFSDRVGSLAYALTPLTVALSTRESILTLATGIPYQSLNFLHRWLGRVIFIQSFLHTLTWTIIEGRLYQPQPSLYKAFINETYIVWGVIAMTLLTFLLIFSTQRVIRMTGHEFFRKSHYVVAMVYIGACWAHWSHLACWMIASLGIWGIDRGVRLVRTALIHVGYLDGSKGMGFHPSQSSVQYFEDEDGGAVRLDFEQKGSSWNVGQHFFLCFPALTIWQSHPLTVASIPQGSVSHHTYIIRCRKGETGRLKSLVLDQELAPALKETLSDTNITTPVILCGPYGSSLLPSTPSKQESTNILAIAGGTGVSLTLPVVLAATSSPAFEGASIDFIWIVRRASNLDWIASELAELKLRAKGLKNIALNIHIYVTQEKYSSSSVPLEKSATMDILPVAVEGSEKGSRSEKESLCGGFAVTYLDSKQPSLRTLVGDFVEQRAQAGMRTRVLASGPQGMGRELREVVAGLNDGGRVVKGERRWDVDLHWDDRMG